MHGYDTQVRKVTWGRVDISSVLEEMVRLYVDKVRRKVPNVFPGNYLVIKSEQLGPPRSEASKPGESK